MNLVLYGIILYIIVLFLSRPHLLDLRHDFVGVPRGGSLHTPREAERARLHLARNTTDAALIDSVAERIRKNAITKWEIWQ